MTTLPFALHWRHPDTGRAARGADVPDFSLQRVPRSGTVTCPGCLAHIKSPALPTDARPMAGP